MAQADVIALVQLLAGGLVDAATATRFYQDVVQDLAPLSITVSLALIEHDSGDAVFDAPADALAILGVVYDGTVLSRESARGLDAITPEWRTLRGSPRSYITETEGDRRVRIVPAPLAPSAPFLPAHGDLLGRDWPAGAVGILYAVDMIDVPLEYEVPVALLVLARAFTIESAVQDLRFAKACHDVGASLLQALTQSRS